MNNFVPYSFSEASFWRNNSCHFILIFYFFPKSLHSLLNFWRVFRVKKRTANVEVPMAIVVPVVRGGDNTRMSIKRRWVCILVRWSTLDKTPGKGLPGKHQTQNWWIHSQWNWRWAMVSDWLETTSQGTAFRDGSKSSLRSYHFKLSWWHPAQVFSAKVVLRQCDFAVGDRFKPIKNAHLWARVEADQAKSWPQCLAADWEWWLTVGGAERRPERSAPGLPECAQLRHSDSEGERRRERERVPLRVLRLYLWRNNIQLMSVFRKLRHCSDVFTLINTVSRVPAFVLTHSCWHSNQVPKFLITCKRWKNE